MDDPFGSALTRSLLDDRRKIFRRQAHLLGIEIQATLGAVMGRHQIKELFEQLFLPPACFLAQRLSPVANRADFVKQGENQVFDNFPVIRMSRALQFLFNQIAQLQECLQISVMECKARIVPDRKIELETDRRVDFRHPVGFKAEYITDEIIAAADGCITTPGRIINIPLYAPYNASGRWISGLHPARQIAEAHRPDLMRSEGLHGQRMTLGGSGKNFKQRLFILAFEPDQVFSQ